MHTYLISTILIYLVYVKCVEVAYSVYLVIIVAS
jgi:hypothetical protein